MIRNSHSGALVAKYCVANGRTRFCCFSPNGRLVAFAVNNTAYIWDITSPGPHPIKTFVGHTGNITSLEFSSVSSLISSSYDKSVKFWQIDILPTDSAMTDPESTPLTLVPIKSITLQAKANVAISSNVDGVVRTWDVSTGCCKASFQTPPKNNFGSDVRLIGSRLISAWCVDVEGSMEGLHERIHVWDVEKGELLQTVYLDNRWRDVKIRISGDGSKIFSLCSKCLQAWSIQTGKIMGVVELKHYYHDRSLTADDGSKVWVHYPQSKSLGWDFGIQGSHPVQLSDESLLPPNSTKLWDTAQSRIEDTATGKMFFQLAGKFLNPVASQWDGQYLVAGYESGEVLILDFNHNPLVEF